mmetsp:Transcript_18411/g.24302  ORF Transcript_18411/g.24302 Transcript_18411/m.24302 type:complete len:124 (-) Transcript_18411:18-389(-)
MVTCLLSFGSQPCSLQHLTRSTPTSSPKKQLDLPALHYLQQRKHNLLSQLRTFPSWTNHPKKHHGITCSQRLQGEESVGRHYGAFFCRPQPCHMVSINKLKKKKSKAPLLKSVSKFRFLLFIY